MKAVLLITVTFTLALGFNPQPCLRNSYNNAYNEFVRKHILKERFDRESVPAWEKYINDMKLCDFRRPQQSFFEKSDQEKVAQICNGYGHPLINGRQGNLCISDSTIPGYYMNVNNNCKVNGLVPTRTNVIVACDVVENQCRPVHFEKYNRQIPNTRAAPCQP